MLPNGVPFPVVPEATGDHEHHRPGHAAERPDARTMTVPISRSEDAAMKVQGHCIDGMRAASVRLRLTAHWTGGVHAPAGPAICRRHAVTLCHA
jgi:hypothetical protein